MHTKTIPMHSFGNQHPTYTCSTTNPPNTIPSGFSPVSVVPEHKYKVGEIVKITFSPDEYEIKEHCGTNLWSIPEYMLRETKSGNIVYNMETEMSPVKQPGGAPLQPKSKCECGAVKTYGKDASSYHHSTWCPKGDKA
jgi:hypothetical protein